MLLWGNNYQSNLKPTVTLQKKAIRIITFSKPDEHSESLFKRLELLKLIDLVYYQNALFTYQYHNHMLPRAYDEFLKEISSVHKYNTRLAV